MDAARWPRISFRVGAAVDAAVAALLLSPRLYARALGMTGFAPGDDARHAMGMGAALMLGWTALLLWADREPLERRGVLPLTVLVIAGLAANEVRSVRAGFLPLAPLAVVWALQLALAVLFLGSWATARRAAAAGPPAR
jgi:hypothetical protein